MKWVPKTVFYDLPKKSTADSIAETVRAILSQPDVVVSQISITSDPPEIKTTLHVKNTEPPDGELPEPQPDDIWGVLQVVELEEVSVDGSAREMLMSVFLKAAKRGLAVTGIVVNDRSVIKKWLGVEEDISSVLVEIVEIEDTPEDRIVVLAGPSRSRGPLGSKYGFMLCLERSE